MINAIQTREKIGQKVPIYVVRQLLFALEDVLGEDAKETLGYLGYRLGLQTFEGATSQEEVNRRSTDAGIGSIEAVSVSENQYRIRLSECLGCSGMAQYNENISAFETGIMRGAIQALTGRQCDAVEVKCCTTGGTYCEFDAFLVS